MPSWVSGVCGVPLVYVVVGDLWWRGWDLVLVVGVDARVGDLVGERGARMRLPGVVPSRGVATALCASL